MVKLVSLVLNFALLWKIAGSATMIDGRVERFVYPNITENSYADTSGLKVRKVKKKSMIIGNIQVFREYDNNCEIEIFLYKLQGNEYRLTPYKIKRTKYCDLLMSEPMVIPKIYEGFNVKYECPIKVGNYSGEFEFDFSGVPPYFEGRYKTVTIIYLPGNFTETYETYVEIHHYQE